MILWAHRFEMAMSEAASVATRSELGPPSQVPRESLKSAARHLRKWRDSRERPATSFGGGRAQDTPATRSGCPRLSSAGVGVDGDTLISERYGDDLMKMGAPGRSDTAGERDQQAHPKPDNGQTSLSADDADLHGGQDNAMGPIQHAVSYDGLAGSTPARQQPGPPFWWRSQDPSRGRRAGERLNTMEPYRKYTMTEEDLDIIKRASRPVRYMIMDGKEPPSPQENANAAWSALAEKLGFDPMTVRPSGADERDFIARPI